MTYGENSEALRGAMTYVLGCHRITQRLGGPGTYRQVPWSTEAQRREMGQIIQRYRLAALTWCLEAVTAASPQAELYPTSARPRTTAEQLRLQLGHAVQAANPGGRLVDLLATSHHNELLDGWQRLARASMLGEHDFTAGVSRGALSTAQAATVIKDAVDLTRALLVVDRRYKNVPGWRFIANPKRLGEAVDASTQDVSAHRLDVTVDQVGWRPAPEAVNGPAPAGVAGAVQAQHNVLVDLAHFPHALNLRRILHSQAQLSHVAAKYAAVVDPALAAGLSERAETYRQLVRASRNVGGLVGAGALAATESANAVSRITVSRSRDADAGEPLNRLVTMSARIDVRIATTIEQGFRDCLYLVARHSPCLDGIARQGIRSASPSWLPVVDPGHAPMLQLARDGLRPRPLELEDTLQSVGSRADYEAVLAAESARIGHRR